MHKYLYIIDRKLAGCSRIAFVLPSVNFRNGFYSFFGNNSLHLVGNDIKINNDSVAYAILTQLGYYDRLPIPFLVDSCEPIIRSAHLPGFWRSVTNLENIDWGRFSVLTFSNAGKFQMGIASTNHCNKTVEGAYTLTNKSNLLEFNVSGEKRTYKILKLSDNCFEYEFRGDIFKFGRVPEDPFISQSQ